MNRCKYSSQCYTGAGAASSAEGQKEWEHAAPCRRELCTVSEGRWRAMQAKLRVVESRKCEGVGAPMVSHLEMWAGAPS